MTPDEALRDMLDSVRQALAVFEVGGTLVFRSRALQDLRRHEHMSDLLDTAMEEMAGSLTRRAEVKTGPRSYALWGSLVQPTVFGMEGVLVQVDRRGSIWPGCEDVQAHFALTPREAEVALLLAEGLDNRCIGERLAISPHTARRHTERVMRGLGINSRAAVAVRLLQRP